MEIADSIQNPSDVIGYIEDIRELNKEYFIALILNARNKVLHKEIISVGTLTASLVHPREVFEPALRFSGAAIIVAHNHPSGNTEPSEYDLSITKRLCEAGELLGIELLDHIIITSSDFLSFKEQGIM